MTEASEPWKDRLGALSVHERADLAHFLIQSLDETEEDPSAEAAWDAELSRRAEEIVSGKAIGIPAEQVFAELREKYT